MNKIEYTNEIHFGLLPKSTTDAAVAGKQLIEPELDRGTVVVMASLDVKGAFDAAWWPAVLNGLREARCPQNLYRLKQDYFREKIAVISINSAKWRRKLLKASHKGHAADPDFGIYGITVFNLRYSNHAKTIVFAKVW